MLRLYVIYIRSQLADLIVLPNVFLNQVSIFCSQILDQLGVVLDQECVVVAVEVDVLKQLLLAHLGRLLFQSFSISSPSKVHL